MIKRNDTYFIAVALVLFCLSVFLHFWKLGQIPDGFFFDEVSIGYNAWCIEETGADEYGIKFPVFFKCFDNYQDPVYVYVLAGMVKIFGPEKWVVRFPSGLFHVLASIAFFFLATKYVRNRFTCLGAAFIFSILPWIFPLSRSGMGGYTPMLLGMTAGWYFIVNAIGRRSMLSAVFAGCSWAFVMYSHQIGRPMGAVLLICFVVSMNKLIFKRMKAFALFSTVYLVCMLPMIVYVWNHPESMTKRFSNMSVWSTGGDFMDSLLGILQRYLEYFSPNFLFISGDPVLRHNSGGSGELFIFLAPFVIAGIFCFYRDFFRNPYVIFATLAIVIYPLAAILTIDHMHGTRALNGTIPWMLLALVGADFAWRRKVKFRPIVIAVLCFSVIEVSYYFVNYFDGYALKARNSFFASFVETVETSFANLGKDDTLYISSSFFHHPVDKEFKPVWYIYFLFLGNIHPAVYQKTGIPKEYIQPYEGKISRPGIFIRMNSVMTADDEGNPMAVLNTEPVPENSKLLRKIPLSEGSNRFFEVYRVY